MKTYKGEIDGYDTIVTVDGRPLPLRLDLRNHPSTLFQCLWNSAWWYDSESAASRYDPPDGGWSAEAPPWSRSIRLSPWLESWRRLRESRTPRVAWLAAPYHSSPTRYSCSSTGDSSAIRSVSA